MSQIEKDDVTGVDTTGHEWDGIKELNNPMPRWWLWTFYACIVWAIGYCIAFPAWPLIENATPETALSSCTCTTTAMPGASGSKPCSCL